MCRGRFSGAISDCVTICIARHRQIAADRLIFTGSDGKWSVNWGIVNRSYRNVDLPGPGGIRCTTAIVDTVGKAVRTAETCLGRINVAAVCSKNERPAPASGQRCSDKHRDIAIGVGWRCNLAICDGTVFARAVRMCCRDRRIVDRRNRDCGRIGRYAAIFIGNGVFEAVRTAVSGVGYIRVLAVVAQHHGAMFWRGGNLIACSVAVRILISGQRAGIACAGCIRILIDTD